MSEKVYIFDTTLRDGEQSAGVSFSLKEKIKIAKQLERLGVDIIEAGFPRTSPGDMESVKAISKEVRGSTICALARAVKEDIDAAWEAIREAEDPRLHVFVNTSDIQIANQLCKGRDDVLQMTETAVKYAKQFTSNVEFSPMDATRSDLQFLYKIIETSIAAGATTVNVPDSVGYGIPEEVGRFFAAILENVPNIQKARLSVHAHNDLGLCTANTLSAIQNGARQAEVAVNGIGERAGNTSLEEVVMAIRTRKDFFHVHTDINPGEIYRTSKLVERYSGMPIQWNKAIVGKNAFRHGSGIHQDGLLKMRETWEIMDPKDIGIPQGSQIVIGKLSGRHAFRDKLQELGYELTEAELEKAFKAFKKVADKKNIMDDRDIEAIAEAQLGYVEAPAWTLDHVQVTAGNKAMPTASLQLIGPDGILRKDAATGTGPIDAVYQAMNRITGITPKLTEFRVKAVTEGIDAQGEVTIRIEKDGRAYVGRSSHTDIIVASARAYSSALNRLVLSTARSQKQNMQEEEP